MEIRELKTIAKNCRIHILRILKDAGGGHFGGSLSVVDILTALYFGGILKVDPKLSSCENRDRLVLSKGHACAALCPCLAEKGFFPVESLKTFNQFNSPFGMHPDMRKIPGCDISTGSLGHGLSMAVGMALAGKLDHSSYRVFSILGDSEIQSGMTYEALMAAGNFGLDNLVMIIDRNGYSMDGPTEELMGIEPLQDKLASLKWSVTSMDGHDFRVILQTLKNVPIRPGRPSAVIAHTVKGKGISFMEATHLWHYRSVDDQEFQLALKELEMSECG
jgi:transketolase